MAAPGERETSITSPVYRYRHPATLPAIEARAVGVAGGPSGIAIERPGWQRPFLCYAAEFVDDPDDTGLFANLGTVTTIYPPAFTIGIDAASVIGYRTILYGDTFFNDETYGPDRLSRFLQQLSSSDRFPNEDTGLQRQGNDTSFILTNTERPVVDLKGVVAVLCSHEPPNYGSFIFRVLPKIYSLRQLGLEHLPTLVYEDHPAKLGFLQLCGLDISKIIRHDYTKITKVERAVIPSLRSGPLLDHETRALFREVRNRFGTPQVGRRIYISRLAYSRASTRVMINEEELIRRLSNIGFDIIEPESLSATDQVQVFSSASLIVGPGGSGLFNSVFCHPGTKLIDIESEPHWINSHAALFASCELRYGIFVGRVDDLDPRPVHRRWTVNIDALISRIESFARR